MNFDVWIQSLNIAFEYNGEMHYQQQDLFPGRDRVSARDIVSSLTISFLQMKEKRKTCKLNGLTLIDIPFWWDRQKESLRATIHKYRPELISNSETHNSIPLQNPNFERNK